MAQRRPTDLIKLNVVTLPDGEGLKAGRLLSDPRLHVAANGMSD